MTAKNDKAARPLNCLADSFVEDILNMSDEEVLAEFQEDGGDAEQYAAYMRAKFEDSLLKANKTRMAIAKAGVSANRATIRTASRNIVDFAEARARLHAVIERAKSVPGLTLAARKEEELSDSDVLGMLEELAELGLLDEDSESGIS
ncbi:hypothetical protein [Rhodospirillum sp. A1_3_36]|uniref:hypothetical protein n=1 Tax=Rhodospirillum sp. A1_3_36 TaxID=3391666 RepID=UPI0039A40822